MGAGALAALFVWVRRTSVSVRSQTVSHYRRAAAALVAIGAACFLTPFTVPSVQAYTPFVLMPLTIMAGCLALDAWSTSVLLRHVARAFEPEDVIAVCRGDFDKNGNAKLLVRTERRVIAAKLLGTTGPVMAVESADAIDVESITSVDARRGWRGSARVAIRAGDRELSLKEAWPMHARPFAAAVRRG